MHTSENEVYSAIQELRKETLYYSKRIEESERSGDDNNAQHYKQCLTNVEEALKLKQQERRLTTNGIEHNGQPK